MKKKKIKKNKKKAVVKPTKKKKVKPVKKKARVKAEVKPKNKGYRKLKDGSFRIYGWRVVSVGTEKFPELVSVEKKDVVKRFVTLEHAVKFIESQESEKLINSGERAVIKELKSVGLGALVADVSEQSAEKPVESKELAEEEVEEIDLSDN